MAYMSQDRKKELAPGIKAVLKKYGMKGTIGVDNRSTLVVNLRAGKIDFIADMIKKESDLPHIEKMREAGLNMRVNEYWYDKQYAGKALEFLSELIPAMMKGNYDNSDVQSDYHDVGWYIAINVGRWGKPYQLES